MKKMKTVGIICEYNPLHKGHVEHIEKTREALGGDTTVVSIMSGNFVQRGDFAIFNKHARAKMAVHSNADLIIELPTPYVLQSAEGFAKAGVYLLDCLGVCDYLSFGSEIGNIESLQEAAGIIASGKAQMLTKEWLAKGLSYASAMQKAADTLMGEGAAVFRSPNNMLGIEYIKAIEFYALQMRPMTVVRTGGDHDGDSGYSASFLRKELLSGSIPFEQMPGTAVAACTEESVAGRGPVSIIDAEIAILSRLRALKDYADIQGFSEGLERRFELFSKTEPSVESILSKVKSKRYAMARLRRLLMCAVLGISRDYTSTPPPYIRVLAMNEKGMALLRSARKKAKLPIITKPASVHQMAQDAKKLFDLEAAATDFYVLAYKNESERVGGQEWRQSPVVM